MTVRHDPADGEPEPGSRSAAGPGGPPAWVQEPIVTVRPSLVITETADASRIARMRRDFTAWLAIDVRPGDLLDDLVLAVYEALANVAEHAYADTPVGIGAVSLTADRAIDALRITVSDRGHWRADREVPFRSRGLAFIRLLMSQVHITSDGAGTDVHLRTGLPHPIPPGSS